MHNVHVHIQYSFSASECSKLCQSQRFAATKSTFQLQKLAFIFLVFVMGASRTKNAICITTFIRVSLSIESLPHNNNGCRAQYANKMKITSIRLNSFITRRMVFCPLIFVVPVQRTWGSAHKMNETKIIIIIISFAIESIK